MQIQRDLDLQSYNTLGVPAIAELFCAAETVQELREALVWARARQMNVWILGGGSNVVVAPRVSGLVVHMRIAGRQVLARSESEVLLRIGAGENWHGLVEWCLENQFYGLENLALIPGTVGAAPVQNIGAYGVEIAQFVERVECVSTLDGTPVSLRADQCKFAYRDSVFKNDLQNRLVITAVVLRLNLRPRLETTYPALQDALPADPTPVAVFETVCRIRRSKLPDPQDTPNCGSFFKNPIVAWNVFQSLLQRYPSMPSYAASSCDDVPRRKLAAAWLIDQAGWRGKTVKNVKVHEHQALVITNPARVGADTVLEVASMIQMEVLQKFGVSLEMEPQPIGVSIGG